MSLCTLLRMVVSSSVARHNNWMQAINTVATTRHAESSGG